MMRGRKAQMNARMNQNMNHHNDANIPQKGQAQQQQVPQQQQQPPQQQQQQQQMKTNVMPGVHGKPGTGGPPGPGVLEAVKKVQEEARQQQQSFGKGNPGMTF